MSGGFLPSRSEVALTRPHPSRPSGDGYGYAPELIVRLEFEE